MKRITKKHSGYVALIGRTNAGKSTFLNSIMGVKVSIVSDKPQTTRKQILGIKTTKRGQIVFFDSPGVHKPRFKLNEKMMKDVHNSLNNADVILYFVEISDRSKDSFIIDLLKEKKNVFLVITKIDQFKKSRVLEKIEKMKDLFHWKEIIPVSALNGDNLPLLEDLIYDYLPESDQMFFNDDQYTVQSEKFYLSELIREKILFNTRDEMPFTTMVNLVELKDRGEIIYIRSEIYVETQSQKKIIIGKQGKKLKTIGETARIDLEDYLEKKVFLDLFVKVVPNWRNSRNILSESFN